MLAGPVRRRPRAPFGLRRCSAEFCAAVRAFEEADPTGDIFATEDPEQIEAEWDEFGTLIGALIDDAPAEIAADFELVASSFGLLRTAYERAGWDVLRVYDVVESDSELAAVFLGSDPELDAANVRIDAYIEQVCGITTQ